MELSKNLKVVFSNNVSLNTLEFNVWPQIVIVGSIGGQIIVNKDIFCSIEKYHTTF